MRDRKKERNQEKESNAGRHQATKQATHQATTPKDKQTPMCISFLASFTYNFNSLNISKALSGLLPKQRLGLDL